MKISIILSDGQNTTYKDVEATETLVIDLREYEVSKEVDDIYIDNEGQPLVPPALLEKEASVSENQLTFPPPNPSRKQPWEMF